MAQGRKASLAKTAIKTLVYGDYGSRKSGFASDFAKMKREDGKPMRVLYLDLENGSIEGFHLERLANEGVDLNNIYIIYTSVYKEVNDILDKVIKKEEFYEYDEDGNETDIVVLDADGEVFHPDAVVIDGITVLADEVKDAMIEVSEIRAGIRADVKQKTKKEASVDIATAGMEFKDWDKLKSRGKRLVRTLIKSTDIHLCITGRAKEVKEMKRDSSGNMISVPTGKYKLESWDFIPYEVNTVVFNKSNDDGNVYGIVEEKDRTGMFAQGKVLKNPSISMWQPVIEKNKGRAKSIAMNLETYDESSKKEISGQISIEVVVPKDNIDDLKMVIETTLSSLTPSEKKILASKCVDNGLPDFKEYKDFTDLEKVKKLHSIIAG